MVFASGNTSKNPPKTPAGLAIQKWKLFTAHNAQAAVGFARKQTQNSNNRKKVLSELKCPFTWELSSLKKKNMHTLDSSSQGKPLLWAQGLTAQRENSAQPDLKGFVLLASDYVWR